MKKTFSIDLFVYLFDFFTFHAIDSPIKLTKRWRKNHEEEQLRNNQNPLFQSTNEIVSESINYNQSMNYKSSIDLFGSGTGSCSSNNTAQSVVNWLTQQTNPNTKTFSTSHMSMSNANNHAATSELASSPSPTSSSSSCSSSTSSSSDDPFSCLYLLASAAVGELERQRLKANSVSNIALAVNS